MHNIHLLFIEDGQVLVINLILWRKTSSIQIIPLDKEQSDSDELVRWIKDWVERIIPIVLDNYIGQQSIEKKRQENTSYYLACVAPLGAQVRQ